MCSSPLAMKGLTILAISLKDLSYLAQPLANKSQVCELFRIFKFMNPAENNLFIYEDPSGEQLGFWPQIQQVGQLSCSPVFIHMAGRRV